MVKSRSGLIRSGDGDTAFKTGDGSLRPPGGQWVGEGVAPRVAATGHGRRTAATLSQRRRYPEAARAGRRRPMAARRTASGCQCAYQITRSGPDNWRSNCAATTAARLQPNSERRRGLANAWLEGSGAWRFFDEGRLGRQAGWPVGFG